MNQRHIENCNKDFPAGIIDIFILTQVQQRQLKNEGSGWIKLLPKISFLKGHEAQNNQELFEIYVVQCADDDKIGIDGTRDSLFPKEVQIGRQNWIDLGDQANI